MKSNELPKKIGRKAERQKILKYTFILVLKNITKVDNVII
jgi:hypothetical protein